MPRYKVKPNYCNCHPETCCCDDWAVIDTTDQSTFTTCFRKDAAIATADALNLQENRNTLPAKIAALEDALRPFLLKVDISAVLRLPPKTKVLPKRLTAGDYQAAAKAINLDELLPSAQQGQSSS